MYCKVSIAIWVPKSFCAAAVVCFLPLHIHGQKYIHAHAVSPFTPEPRVELFQFVLISVSRRSCNFLSFKTVLCHLMVSPWVPWQELSWATFSPPCSLKQKSSSLWELLVWTPLSPPAGTQLGLLPFANFCVGVDAPSWKANPKHIWRGPQKEVTQSKVQTRNLFFFPMLCWLLRGGLCSSSKQTEDENSCERAGIKYV